MPPRAQRESRYRRQEVLLELLMDNKNIRSQTELQQMLEKRGIVSTQSSVSRDLKDMGIKRVKGRYVLPAWKTVGQGDFQQVLGFVQSVSLSGDNLLVILTSPSAARVVAWAIDTSGWAEVKGTVAGEDTIFVAVGNEEEQAAVYQRIEGFMHGTK